MGLNNKVGCRIITQTMCLPVNKPAYKFSLASYSKGLLRTKYEIGVLDCVQLVGNR